jgi:hypothetical protein
MRGEWFCGIRAGCALVVLAVAASVVSGAEDGAGTTGDASNEVKVLKAQVENLVEALAGARREVDSLRARMSAREFTGHASVSLKPAQMSVDESVEPQMLGADRELRMVVLDQGARQGLQPGMKFAVLREDKLVAELEAIDVRERLAGAAVVSTRDGMFPVIGDRLMRIAVLTK